MVRWDWIKQNSYKRNIFVIGCSLLIGILSGIPIARHLHNTSQIEKAHSYIRHFSSLLTDKRVAKALGAVAKLAAQPILIETVAGKLPPDNSMALLVLEHAKFLCDSSLIYLLNHNGDTVACTPYAHSKTLTGKNYSFRPYFTEPMKTGHSYSYPALGVTTGKRGLYFSAPVQTGGQNIGVVVIKIGLNFIDEELRKVPYPCAMLTKDGIVFASNRSEWLFKTAYPLTPERRAQLAASRQFAAEELVDLPLIIRDRNKPFTFEGKTVVPTIAATNFHQFSYISLFPLLSPPATLTVEICGITTMGAWLFLYVVFSLLDRRRFFATLRARERDYRSIIDNLQASFCRVDNQDRFIQISPGMAEFYHAKSCDCESLIGIKAETIWLDAEKRQIFLKALKENGGKIKNFACQLVKNDGSIAHVIVNASYFFDENDIKQGIEGFIYDVTDILKLQQQLLLLDSAIQVASNAVVITDAEGTVTWINRAFTALTGYDANEVIGQKISILKSGYHDEEFYVELWQVITGGKVWHGELTNKRKDESIYFEEMTITPILDDAGVITNFIAIKNDITARKQQEEEKEEMLARQKILNQRLAEEKMKSNNPDTLTAKEMFPDLAGIKILLVGDDSFEQLLVLELLQKQNGTVFSAKNSREISAALSTINKYSLVLIDQDIMVTSPEIKQLITATNKSSVILLMSTAPDAALSQDLGSQGTILKPLDPTQFYAEIVRCLSADNSINKPTPPRTSGNQILDRETALKRVMGNEKTYAMLLRSFKDIFQNSIKDMVKALAEGKVDELKMMVHTLKGAAGGVGGDILQQSCAELEKHISIPPDSNKLGPQLDILARHLDDLLAEITPDKENDTAIVTKPAGDEKIARRLFRQYGSAIAMGKFKEGQQFTSELSQYNWTGCFFAEMTELQHLLDDYAFDQAATLLRSLEQQMSGGELTDG